MKLKWITRFHSSLERSIKCGKSRDVLEEEGLDEHRWEPKDKKKQVVSCECKRPRLFKKGPRKEAIHLQEKRKERSDDNTGRLGQLRK